MRSHKGDSLTFAPSLHQPANICSPHLFSNLMTNDLPDSSADAEWAFSKINKIATELAKETIAAVSQ